MSKKKLSVAAITNELKGASVFFANRTDTSQPPQMSSNTHPETSPPVASQRTDFRTKIRTEKRQIELPVRRRTRRYSFEFYDDQIVKLKRLKYEAEMRGERVSLSDFARDALDDYLKRAGSRE